MDEYKPIPISRRVWLLDRMDELREELSTSEREQLLARLASMTYAEWLTWFVQNSERASAYAASTKAERRKDRRKEESSNPLLHHAAMFITGLHEIARSYSFPEPYTSKSERFYFETSAMAVAIRAWDNLEAQVECSLFWQFDEPSCPSSWPFKQE